MSHVPPIPRDASRTSQAPRPVGAAAPRTAAVAVAPPVSFWDPSQRAPLIMLGSLLLLLIIAYFDMLSLVREAWREELYSHGWLMPILALVLLWIRWKPFEPAPAIERWAGVGLVALGLSMRFYAAWVGRQPVDQISFIPCVFGIFMMVGGFKAIRWAWPALAFLVFMFPLPNVWERNVLNELQKLASICSTFVLQTLGMAAFRQGTLITIPGSSLNIAEACAGLRMSTIFVGMSVFMIFIIERPWWDKFVIVVSSLPIALLVNIIRITLIGLLYWIVGPDAHIAQKLGHDWAGYFMMVLAMGFLWLELQILERLTVPVETVQMRPVGGPRSMKPVAVR